MVYSHGSQVGTVPPYPASSRPLEMYVCLGVGVAFSFVTVNGEGHSPGIQQTGAGDATSLTMLPTQWFAHPNTPATALLLVPCLYQLSHCSLRGFFFFFKTQIRWCLSCSQSCPLTSRTNKNQNLKSGLQGAASPPVSVQVSLLFPHIHASDSHLSSK